MTHILIDSLTLSIIYAAISNHSNCHVFLKLES
jgi:hypothetical protein